MGIKFIFDLDGTLTKRETLPLIAEYFSLKNEIKELTEKTIKGEIEFDTSFQYRVNLLKNFPIVKIADILYHVEIFSLLLKFIQDNKECCVIASSNLICWIEKLVKQFNCTIYASEPEIVNNKLLGIKKILQKEAIVNKYQQQGYLVIFIGDGNNDLEAMKLADISIAMGKVNKPNEKIRAIANYIVYEEKELYTLLINLLENHNTQKFSPC